VDQRKALPLIPAEQAELAAWLAQLAGAPPTETPISAVFVGPDCVWKLKKSVRLGFLDFSSLAARRHFTRRELALNFPSASGIYRDVVAVRRTEDGGFSFEGDGEPVDVVLRMNRVPPGDFLDRMAADGNITTALLDRIADAVAAYHQALKPVHGRDPVAAMRATLEGNAKSAETVGLPDVPAWRQAAQAALEGSADCLRARAACGLVRRAHGDLHLGNLCLWDGKPVLFDALEFDEDLATIDLGYDLAFLLMDLDRRLDRAASNRVLNRYVARTGDAGFLRPLKLFLSLRAMVRAHVEANAGHQEAAAAYQRQALAYLEPASKLVVAIGGLPGSGKSTVARLLAPDLGPAPGALILRSDEIRKRQHAVPPEQKLPPEAYTKAASEAVFSALFEMASAAAADHAVIADATFMEPAHRTAMARAAGGTPFLGVWLQVDLATLRERITARQGDASDADAAVLMRFAAEDPGPGAWLPVAAVDAREAARAVADAIKGTC
jgi:aminoglycoside phosphotransferase family enzyme/predicted kinase